MQARDVMTREVVTVGPDTSAKYAAEVMAQRGFAALPVLDTEERLVGVVAEVDVLRDRLPEDPRLHLRRGADTGSPPPALLVRGVMTREVRSVAPVTDVADVARLFLDDRLRSVPVVDGDRLVGIVSRRDLLRTLMRPDEEIGHDLLRLVEDYTGEPDVWDVRVADGVATIRRLQGEPQAGADSEERALTALARTVGGVVAVRVLAAPQDPSSAGPDPVRPGTASVEGGRR